MSVRSAQVCRLFFPLLLLASSLVSAQDQGDGGQSDEPDVEPSIPQERTSDPGGIHPYLEYRKRVEAAQSISPLDNGVFGDQVSLYNGATEFSVTDIDIPGNSALPVQLGRRLSVELQPQSMLAPYAQGSLAWATGISRCHMWRQYSPCRRGGRQRVWPIPQARESVLLSAAASFGKGACSRML